MKSVFFGGSEYVLPLLEVLKDRFGLSFVFTTDKEGAVIDFAKQNKIPYDPIFRPSDLKSKILNLKSDIDLGIVAHFGVFVPDQILNLFPKGILGIHPSLLPKYRGPTPVQTAILNGEKETGITIFKMDEKLDHGPILASEDLEIEEDDTTDSLHSKLFKAGANLLEKTLIDYIEEVLVPVPQDESNATYTKLLKKEDGFIDISNLEFKNSLEIRNWKLEIARRIRAYYPWPGVWFKTELNSKSTIVKLLPKNLLQVEGKKPQSHKDFINGYKEGKEILNKLKLD